jgi:flagellar secretion chaperone FliS
MGIESSTANAYLRTKVLSASREELRLMLLDGALKFARQGREGLATKNFEQSFNGISQCRNIVMELLTSIKPEYDPDLCEKVKALYSWMYAQLVEASMERNAAKLDGVIKLLEYERETWVLLMDQVAQEKRGTLRLVGEGVNGQPVPTHAAQSGQQLGGLRKGISLQG